MKERRILELIGSGRTLFHYPLKACVLEGTGEFGVSVPKRNFKRAVRRNLLKRRVREAYRRNGARLTDKYDIFIYYIGKQAEEYGRIEKSLVEILDDLDPR